MQGAQASCQIALVVLVDQTFQSAKTRSIQETLVGRIVFNQPDWYSNFKKSLRIVDGFFETFKFGNAYSNSCTDALQATDVDVVFPTDIGLMSALNRESQ